VLDWGEEGGFPVYLDSEAYLGAYDLQVTAPLDALSVEKGVLFVHSAGNSGGQQSFPGEWNEHRHVDNNGDTITNETFCYSKNASGTDCPASCSGTSATTGDPKCETNRHLAGTPFDTIGVTAAAKNILTVGAVNATNPPQITNFSSRGPAKDGRIKPDVVAKGIGVLRALHRTDRSLSAAPGDVDGLARRGRHLGTADRAVAEDVCRCEPHAGSVEGVDHRRHR
jgi:subtilisin family serine protease